LGPLDLVWHIGNLFAVPVLMGLMAAALAKGLWRQPLRAVPWLALALWASAACCLVTLAGLWWFGRDGRMATYLLTLPACALALWWRGFGQTQRK
jgi:hypothetical protein